MKISVSRARKRLHILELKKEKWKRLQQNLKQFELQNNSVKRIKSQVIYLEKNIFKLHTWQKISN
jgi:hypothetical protein